MTNHPSPYHDEYRALNAGAHRRASIELDTPALTWHLGFWFDQNPSCAHVAAPQLSVATNGPCVDLLVKSIYAKLSRLAGFESNLHVPTPGPNSSNDEVLVLFAGAFTKSGDPAPQSIAKERLVADILSSDNRILSMSALWEGFRVQIRVDFHSEYFTLTTILTPSADQKRLKLASDFDTHLLTLTDLGALPARNAALRPNAAVRDCYRFVYQDVWQRFSKDILGTSIAGAFKIFADFRGLALAGHDGDDVTSCLDAGTFKLKADLGRQFEPRWARSKLVPRMQPFLLCEPDDRTRRQEFTVSYMLRRRAVYMTALGPQPASSLAPRPLHYMLVARPANDWQLGNILDRLHVMGTARLAALMELKALRTAGANIKAVQDQADAARKLLDDGKYEEARTPIEQIKRLTAHVEESTGSIRPIFRSGLQFRVERSRYYVARFRSNLRYLRLGRVEGYEPYDQFVEGRLGDIYDYIDRLGIRHERARAAASDLLQEVQSGLSAKVIKEIENIQFKAELALLTVLVPYYAIGSIHYICETSRACNIKNEAQYFLTIVLVGPALALLSLVRHFYRHRRRWKKMLSTGLIGIILIVVTVVGIYVAVRALNFGAAAKTDECHVDRTNCCCPAGR